MSAEEAGEETAEQQPDEVPEQEDAPFYLDIF
jgi:hypothetical protein